MAAVLSSVLSPAANASDSGDLQKPQYVTHKVFFDIEVDGEPLGRIVLGLFGRLAPKTAQNFAALADGTAGIGNHGKPLHFKGNHFHRIIPGMMAQAGDIINGNGTGGESIYGHHFEDETFFINHYKRYQLAMANYGPNQNNSQFWISFGPNMWLNGKYVIFGRVLEGFETADWLEIYGHGSGNPKKTAVIADCGTLEVGNFNAQWYDD